MQFDVMELLGLHTDEVENAWKKCEDKITELRMPADTMSRLTKRVQNSSHDWDGADLTNSLIDSMFAALQDLIDEEYPSIYTDYYVNGWDSHFTYDDADEMDALLTALKDADDELFKKCLANFDDINEAELSEDQLVELVQAGEMPVILEAISNLNDIDKYDSIDEFGADNDENKGENDSDYEWGKFLLDAYHQGNSNIFCHEFKDGTVIAAYIDF